MRSVVQRVECAAVSVEGEVISQIGRGLLVLLGVAVDDTIADGEWMADKLLGLRIFENEAGKFDNSVVDISGELLVVSQFTLCADVRKGRRPSFNGAAPPQRAEERYQDVIERLGRSGLTVHSGRFGANMQVNLVNDGPVTIVIDGVKEA